MSATAGAAESAAASAAGRFSSVGFSSIAWPGEGFEEGLQLSVRRGFTSVEVAPYSVFSTWDVSAAQLRQLRALIDGYGLVCPALQGILFKVGGLALFDDEGRKALARQLRLVARIAGALGAKACVFGAPGVRNPGELGAAEALDTAVTFFRAVAPMFAEHGTAIAFEANARHYNCRFASTTDEAIEVVRRVDAPGFGLQLDTGTIFLEHEDPGVVQRAVPYAAHAHISEPDLNPIGTSGVDHAPLVQAFARSGYTGSLSIEMKKVAEWQQACDTAAEFLKRNYLS